MILLLQVAITLACATAISEDTVSSQVSHLLGKLEELESRLASSSSYRERRATSDASGVVTYVRWGNDTCPPTANTLYSGVVGGSFYTNAGAAVDPLCLPHDPQYLLYQSGYQGYAYLYGAEYQATGPFDQSLDRNVPCSVCEVNGHTSQLMIPSHYECPPDWTREYYGYLMAGHHGNAAATQYTCMDRSLAQISGSGGNTNGYLFYTVEAHCNHFIPCSDKEVTCVVCTK